jgi:phage-related protein
MNPPKPVQWLGDSYDAVCSFPREARIVVGQALLEAQTGGKHRAAKPLKGFKGAGVLEISDDFDGDMYRAVYTVRIAGVVCVLHAFQKKSKTGIATPKHEMDLIQARLAEAIRLYGPK